jgi:hypothetical protein
MRLLRSDIFRGFLSRSIFSDCPCDIWRASWAAVAGADAKLAIFPAGRRLDGFRQCPRGIGWSAGVGLACAGVSVRVLLS